LKGIASVYLDAQLGLGFFGTHLHLCI